MDGPRELNWKLKRLKVRGPKDFEGADYEIGRPFTVNWTVQTVESGRQSRKMDIN